MAAPKRASPLAPDDSLPICLCWPIVIALDDDEDNSYQIGVIATSSSRTGNVRTAYDCHRRDVVSRSNSHTGPNLNPNPLVMLRPPA